MTKSLPTDFFTKEIAQAYDQNNRGLAPISENMHFLTHLVLKGLPENARVLCVGVGTGAEILFLSKVFPNWSFVGVDPSASMLEICGERLREAGVSERCTLIHGYTQDLPTGEEFNAALSVLVAHFVSRDARLSFFKDIVSRLKEGGYLVNTEISFDLDSPEFPSMLKNWEQIQILMGATSESLANLPERLRESLTVLSSTETEIILRHSGLQMPVRFFQSFMIAGWYGTK